MAMPLPIREYDGDQENDQLGTTAAMHGSQGLQDTLPSLASTPGASVSHPGVRIRTRNKTLVQTPQLGEQGSVYPAIADDDDDDMS